jgi:hypothetical protein
VTVSYVKDNDGQYGVLVDGERIGVVWKFRATGTGSMRRYTSNRSDYGVGHWAWAADLAPEDEYPTRAAAVEDMVSAWRRARTP